MHTLRNLLILTTLMLMGVAVAFYFRPQPVEQRLAMGDKLGGDFTLVSSEGPLSLSDFKGKVLMFYIGYASCPDVCPTALAVAAQAIARLPAAEQPQVTGLFISVDPERDSPEKLASYARFFHPNFRGATGSKAQIDQVVRQYGAYYQISKLENSAMDYAVDHSSRLYLIDTNGTLIAALPHTVSPDELADRIESLL
ncbi:SCO family protein [Neptuniibacter sp. CAU 1671]|uniref:SCO family protein n=1 Tax=Neptuniibacter sp. CAU 1671 TaxID=3032593 RepID=UPI0023DBF12A|nr:SCO family protein [Neptuniibacter sp. CAU 1671]MDF2182775.1 SCO family protein [Neptuniibacter sp. CAU 1671]